MAGQPSQTPLHQMPNQAFGSPRQGAHQRSPQQTVPHVPHGQPAYGPRGTPPSPQQPTGGPRPMYPGQPGYFPPRGYSQPAGFPAGAYYGYPPNAPYQYPGAQYVYYPPGGAPAVPQQQAAAPRPPPVRKSHAIQIIDPNTGKEVNLKNQSKEDKADGHKDESKGKDEEKKHDTEEEVKHEPEEKEAKKEDEEKNKKEEEEEAEKRRKEEEEKEKEKMRAEEEEKERLRKEEEEEKVRARKEEEEKERVRKEEEERLKKEEEDRARVEEEERLKKEEEERLRKEEEERQQKEEEERRKKEEEERLREEEEKKRKEEEDARARADEEARKAEEERVRKEEEEKAQQKAEAEEKERKAAEEEQSKPAEDAPKETAQAEAETAEPAAEAKPTVEAPEYAPGCWSPDHPDAKRLYSLEFLMAFMDLISKRPDGMTVYPDVDRVLAPEQAAAREAAGGAGRGGRQPMRGGHMGGPGGFRQMSNDGGFRGPAGQGMRREPSLGRGRGARGGPGLMPMPVRGPAFGMPMRPMFEPPVEKLKVSENAWRPPVNVDPNAVEDPEQKEKLENELLFRKLKGLLNKLTVDKFERLSDQIMALDINTSTRLKGAIYIVFDKALDEPTFSSMYAQLCLKMSKLEIPGESEEGKPKNTFRRHLLNKCQDEFEKEREFTQSDKSVAAEDEAMVRAKLRMLGNIKFIGELFKLDMLTEKIMHQCVLRLLQNKSDASVPAEESLESLCQLFSTIGRKLDTPRAREHMNAYFERLKSLLNKKEEMPSRIRFMIQDAVELRENNWQPRRAEAQAKTIEQVHKEMQQEQVNKQLARSTSTGGRQDSRGLQRNDSRPGQFGGRGGPQPNADGWTPVGNTNRQTKPADLGALRSMQSRAASTGNDNVVLGLGPAGRGGMGARGWGLQRAGSNKGEPQPPVPQMTYRNQFDILNSQDVNDDKGPSLRPNIAQLRPQAPSPKNLRALSPAQTVPSTGRSPSPSPAPSPKPGVSEEEFKKKTKATVEEYYSIKDLKEAVTCFKELESPQLHKFIVEGLFSAIDDTKKRPEAVSLLVKLAEEGLLTRDDILDGVDPTFQNLDDLSMDMPKLHEYMAQYLAPLVASGRVEFADLGKSPHWEELVKDMMSQAPSKMFAAILSQVEATSGQDTAKKLWTESGLEWSSLLPENKSVDDFLASNNLSYLTA